MTFDAAERPFRTERTETRGLERLRERLYDVMWDDAGIVRDAAGLQRADAALTDIETQLRDIGLPSRQTRAYNLAWHDWHNLANLMTVSRVIVRAAQAREDSRGAHFRSDFPETGELATSMFTRIRRAADGLAVQAVPVQFTRVRPGESLVAT